MKKLQFYGGILVLIALLFLNIFIYSRIFGLYFRHNTHSAAGTSAQNEEGTNDSAHEFDNITESGTTSDKKTEDKTEKEAREAEKAREAEEAAKKAREAAEAKKAREAEEARKAQEAEQAEKTGTSSGKETAGLPVLSDAVLSTIPAFSTLNGPESTFLNVIAGYDDNDYSYTMVDACIPADGSIAEQPVPVTLAAPSNEPGRTYEIQVYSTKEGKNVFLQKGIPSGGTVNIYNLTPGDVCACQFFAEEYPVTLTDSDTDNQKVVLPRRLVSTRSFRIYPYEMRAIRTDSLHNVRDLGGWQTLDGRHVKYGLIYRGSAFDGGQEKLISDTDTALMLDRLGIRNELDLRWDSEIMKNGVSILGDSINYIRVPMELYITFVEDENNGEQLNQIFDMLLCKEPLYFHCAIGCDRTGTLSFLLLGLLGVSESNINKEYELSSFSMYGLRTRNNDESYYREMIFYIKNNYEGATLSEKIRNYLLSRGVSEKKIEAFKAKMVE